jgi:competence CoiA-like predicted nuclease
MRLLVAKRKNGRLFSLLDDQEKSKLAAMRKRETFYCPICGAPVQMKLGSKVSWHFSHFRQSACSYSAEAESSYHLEGKKSLFRWLGVQNVPVKLEPYLQPVKQRPDLLLQTSPKQTALEFQCSSISPDLLIKRTKSYIQARIDPIWILGGNRMSRLKSNVFRLSDMDWLAVRKPSRMNDDLMLLYFCPESRNFAVLTRLLPLGPTRVMAHLRYRPISSFSFHDLYSLDKPLKFTIPKDWLSFKQQKRFYAFRARGRAEGYVRKLSGMYPQIPAAAGWPTPSAYQIETSPFLWQSWLFYKFCVEKPASETIYLPSIVKEFRFLVNIGIFHTRSFPYPGMMNEKAPIMEYISCLVRFGYLKKVNSAAFVKTGLGKGMLNGDQDRLDHEYFEKLFGIF